MEMKLVYDGKEYTAQVGSATGYRRDQYDKLMRQIRKNRRNVMAESDNMELELRTEFEDVQGLGADINNEEFMANLQKTDVKKWSRIIAFKGKLLGLIEDTQYAIEDCFSTVLYDCAKFVLMCSDIPRDVWKSNEFWGEQDYTALDNAISSFRNEITAGRVTNTAIANPVLYSGPVGAERETPDGGEKSEVA